MTQTTTAIHNPVPLVRTQFTVLVNSMDLIHSYYSAACPLRMALIRQLGGRRYELSTGSVRYDGSLYELTPQYTPELVRQAHSKGEMLRFTLTLAAAEYKAA